MAWKISVRKLPDRPGDAAAPQLDRLVPNQASCSKRLCSRFGQGHVRVNADGEELLFRGDPVFHPPVARTVRLHEQKQPAAIIQLIRLSSRLSGADFRVGEVIAGHCATDGADTPTF